MPYIKAIAVGSLLLLLYLDVLHTEAGSVHQVVRLLLKS